MNILVLLNVILFHIQMACEWIPICTFPLVLDATITISLWIVAICNLSHPRLFDILHKITSLPKTFHNFVFHHLDRT